MNCAISMEVLLDDGYVGDWRKAIEQAREAAIKIGFPVILRYASQYSFLVYPNTTDQEIEGIKARRVVVAV